MDVRLAKRAGLLHDIGNLIDHEMEGSHIQIGADLCNKYKESRTVINAVESHHGDVEAESLIACIVQAADTISAAGPGARRETLETYTNRLKQLEDITNSFKGVDKSFAIQAGREIRIMVVPEQVSDADMVLLARDISKQIEAELEYPGQYQGQRYSRIPRGGLRKIKEMLVRQWMKIRCLFSWKESRMHRNRDRRGKRTML